MNLFSISAAAQKGVTTIIEKSGSFLDLGAFGVQLTRLNNMKYPNLTIAKESRRTSYSPCAISGEKLGKESVLPALGSKKPVPQSVGSINIGKKVVENPSTKNKKEISTYQIHNSIENVGFCEQVEGNPLSPTIKSNGRK